MIFTINRTTWSGRSIRLKPTPKGMETYLQAATRKGYKEQTIRQLVSAKRVIGGGGFVSMASMDRWTANKPKR